MTNQGIENRAEFYFKNFGDKERADVEAEIRDAIRDIQSGRYDIELKQVGIDRADLSRADEKLYEINSGQYLTGAEWAIVYIVAKPLAILGVKALTDIWTRIILPRLENRYGSGRVRRDPPTR
jgi:hypothetical protein